MKLHPDFPRDEKILRELARSFEEDKTHGCTHLLVGLNDSGCRVYVGVKPGRLEEAREMLTDIPGNPTKLLMELDLSQPMPVP